jgi:hypothetical protein
MDVHLMIGDMFTENLLVHLTPFTHVELALTLDLQGLEPSPYPVVWVDIRQVVEEDMEVSCQVVEGMDISCQAVENIEVSCQAVVVVEMMVSSYHVVAVDMEVSYQVVAVDIVVPCLVLVL